MAGGIAGSFQAILYHFQVGRIVEFVATLVHEDKPLVDPFTYFLTLSAESCLT